MEGKKNEIEKKIRRKRKKERIIMKKTSRKKGRKEENEEEKGRVITYHVQEEERWRKNGVRVEEPHPSNSYPTSRAPVGREAMNRCGGGGEGGWRVWGIVVVVGRCCGKGLRDFKVAGKWGEARGSRDRG